MLGYTPLGRYTPLSRHTPQAGTHLGKYTPAPSRYTPWAGTPPRQVHPAGQAHTPGWCTPWAGTPLGRYTPWAGTHPWAGTSPGQAHAPGQVHPPTVTAADGTNPTGMLSCLNIKFRFTQGKISTILGCPILRTLDCNRFRMTHRRK